MARRQIVATGGKGYSALGGKELSLREIKISNTYCNLLFYMALSNSCIRIIIHYMYIMLGIHHSPNAHGPIYSYLIH